MRRGPGGNEPTLIADKMKEGKSFEVAVREVEILHGFICEEWWKELNKPVFEKAQVPAKKVDPLK